LATVCGLVLEGLDYDNGKINIGSDEKMLDKIKDLFRSFIP